jgi:serine/threonine-protein kinase
LTDTSRYCSSCGAAVDISSAPTLDSTPAPSARTDPSGPRAGLASGPLTPMPKTPTAAATPRPGAGAHFPPGTMLAERYRIVSLLGRGGMGEVYRADDLKLEQPVALKLLPASLSQNADAQARFLREVRVARQVSHPNVCRVFDIGEADGLSFLTMEYIDGEDLATLLRRIGRLPADKDLEIARQICAGLAAAHDVGLLHRDLKPANIMIDGRGKARVTDFGLAGLAGEIALDERSAGTPAYMAPEQLKGGEPSVRSDIYSLGLVLYELFTGKRAFEAASLRELAELRERGTVTNPSAHVKDIDPLVERVILRCLETHPAQRPATALLVAAALPGGDPLAAALAAGETPSPEMVAAAGDEGALRPSTAVLLLAGLAVCLAAIVLLIPYSGDLGLNPIEKTPEVLRQRARDVLARFGYAQRPMDFGSWWERNNQFLLYLATHGPSPEWHRALPSLRPGATSFRYRQSPRPLAPIGGAQNVNLTNPPETQPGMASVHLDSEGRVLELTVVPPFREELSANAAPPDWNAVFAEAGLEFGRFSAAAPVWNPPIASDARFAWQGTVPGQPAVPLSVTAATSRGRLVHFKVMAPWDHPEQTGAEPAPTIGRRNQIAFGVLFLIALGGAGYLAQRNFRLGRGDTKGATRLAVFLFGVQMLDWLLSAHHLGDTKEELLLLVIGVRGAAFIGAIAWVLYVALEPFVRRHWPQLIISSTRLLTGRYQDPLVGRDLLAGSAFGALLGAGLFLNQDMPYWFDIRGETPQNPDLWGALGPPGHFLDSMLSTFEGAIISSLGIFAILLLLRVILRRHWLALLVLGVAIVMTNLSTENAALEAPFILLNVSVILFVLSRYGILARSMLTLSPEHWYAIYSWLAMGLYVGVAIYGFRAALAGQKLFTADLDA